MRPHPDPAMRLGGRTIGDANISASGLHDLLDDIVAETNFLSTRGRRRQAVS
jgi:hypothetical protein